MSYIYQILNISTGERYIGSTDNLQSRFSSHRRHLKKQSHHSKKLQTAWNIYGENFFEFSLILICDTKDRSLFENRAIKIYNCLDKGYNHVRVGRNGGLLYSKETKEKLHLRNLGRFHSKETREKIRIGNLGRKVSLETREKISKANKGLTKGIPQSPEHLQARIKSRWEGKERSVSEKTKKDISNSLKKRYEVISEVNKNLLFSHLKDSGLSEALIRNESKLPRKTIREIRRTFVKTLKEKFPTFPLVLISSLLGFEGKYYLR